MRAQGVHVAATNHETHAHALLMNRRPEWLEELKDMPQEDATREGLDEWEHIGTGQDLRLTGEQKHNLQAVDMVIAQHAEVFIGNGVRHLAFICYCRLVMDSVVH